MIGEQLLAIVNGSQLEAAKIAANIHPDDILKADEFASFCGGWDTVGVRFPEILAGATDDEQKGRLSDAMRATIIGIAALLRAQGKQINV